MILRFEIPLLPVVLVNLHYVPELDLEVEKSPLINNLSLSSKKALVSEYVSSYAGGTSPPGSTGPS